MNTSIKPLLFLILGLILLSCSQPKKVPPPEPYGATPNKQQMRWHKMGRIAFLHFNMNTFTGKEWGWGGADPDKFHPTNFSPNQIVGTLAKAGFKGVILTAKHHDGFCLWPSKYSDYTVAQSEWQNGNGDVVQAIAEACRKYGIKFGVYLSPWDRHQADYGKKSYIKYYKSQLRELLTSYGKLFEVWFDGANGGSGYYGGANEERKVNRSTYYPWKEIFSIVRKYQPQAIIFSDIGPDVRWVGNENGFASDSSWATYTPKPREGFTEAAPGTIISNEGKTGTQNGKYWMPAEADVSIRPGWFYHASEDDAVKSLKELVTIYFRSVGRGAKLLLNVPPTQAGRINSIDSTRLMMFDRYLREAFDQNLFAQATASASIDRGHGYKASNVLDGNYDTYWATPDSVLTGSIVIKLDEKKRINCIKLQEYIPLGQRVSDFTVEAFLNGQWVKTFDGSTIGYQRIFRFDPIKTDRIRINIEQSLALPVINNIEGYYIETVKQFKIKSTST